MRIGAIASMLGGALRIAAAFIPYTPDSPSLEVIYGIIDLALLLGLVSIYVHEAKAIGWPGTIAFALPFASLASIVGPDAQKFGIDWYQTGAVAAALGMAAFGATLLARGRQVLPALCWLATPAISLLDPPPFAVQGAGIVFGLGFLIAGLAVLKPPAAGTG